MSQGKRHRSTETAPLRSALPSANDPLRTTDSYPAQTALPAKLGRYRVTARLGAGGFGVVYRGRDDELQRDVAIKVPLRERVATPPDAEAYLAEARVVAALDHPHIVPVHDVGRTEDGLCFVVSKFIDGTDLAAKIAAGRLPFDQSATLIATMAEALHYAHKQRLVHRDVKPANILIDSSGKPYLADFGLALKDEDYGKGAGLCGTPAYMSPEQAAGEGHRVDGRTDIFSLGVIFYELLTGRRPIRGNIAAVMNQIVVDEPRPPRQIEDAIPKELERICLKALAKRASNRYTTARDLADDLRCFLERPESTLLPNPVPTPTSASASLRDATPSDRPLKIVPKGLRSFDAHDADFFLELLPGPRDRDGLPDSIRFWKTRIEESDPDNTFSVGLIYGPSGCGKSSLVKAGLLPRLADSVSTIYVEATAEDTEARLLNGLHKRLVAAAGSTLKDTLAALRRGQGLAPGKKVLIVLDQFEQWLHVRKDEQNTELVHALRQCDGAHLQCIVMVRDDFWMAATRFMRELEFPLLEGQNSSAVDLFPLRHAEKVLTGFGRAFGILPERSTDLGQDAKLFVEESVRGLAQENKVICVRLALFAEMMKGRAWTLVSLEEGGGTEGVGVSFLEETFSSKTAAPQHRYHQKAARAVLKALLPEAGSDMKGYMRSHEELLEASEYANRPKDFDDVMGILDRELRLITPTDSEGVEEASGGHRLPVDMPDAKKQGADVSRSPATAFFYQLTHDYLVPSLRDWLTRKQKETRRGRAELLLADRAGVWNSRSENRQLPSLWQWLQIRWLTKKKGWTPPQRRMMRRATRFHVLRAGAVLILLALIGFASWEGYGRVKAQHLRDNVLSANLTDVPDIVKNMGPYRRWVDPLLKEAYADAAAKDDSQKQLRASLALLQADADQVTYLQDRLLHGDPDEVKVIRQALKGYHQDLSEGLWELLQDPTSDQDQRFRAACALAAFVPGDPRWGEVSDAVAATLAAQRPFEIARWTELLKPVGKSLLPALAYFLEDERRSSGERGFIATVYRIYAADLPDAYERLEKPLAEASAPDATEDDKLQLLKKQANIATALMAMDHGDKAWPLLKHSPDPTLRSYLIERLGPGGVDSRWFLKRLDDEKDIDIRRAALLSLGQFGLDRLPDRQNLLARIVDLYHNDPDAGIHGAARWLLRQWQSKDEFKKTEEDLASFSREPLASAEHTASRGKRQWSVNSHGQTMVAIPKPRDGRFWMGEGTQRHQQTMAHDFEMSRESVTVGQFLEFRKGHQYVKQFAPTKDCPIIDVSWYEAAEYCNWLSDREGIKEMEWCYEPNNEGKYAEGMKIKPGYLKLQGYRLPTEAEWEYACRAGSQVGYSFGEPAELLEKYGWFDRNSLGKSHPGGLLKPNDMGLFDMHGNVWTWTQDVLQREALEKDDDHGGAVDGASPRMLRGGGWGADAGGYRAADRRYYQTGDRGDVIGFRLARVPVQFK